ncbi:MAG: sulfatase-like hydrolase/transferase [Cyanobacteria bacterium P01_H01_bin.105]
MKKQKKEPLNNKEARKATTLPGMDNSWPDPNPKRPSNDPTHTTGPDAFVDYDLDIRDAKTNNQDDWNFYSEPKAPAGKPNILYIVIDDTGFGAWSMFGGKIQMPNLERIANKGLIYTNFHTTALCSPTRSSLLNGRNANSNGMACIEEATSAFPGSNGRIPRENALIAETLGERGYNTYCIGKWHLAPEEESNMASAKRNWPLGRGFERYYGFLGGETDQWYPDLIYDNHIVEPPDKPHMDDPVNGYHLSKDLVDKAISFIQDGKAIAPTKPWMMYFCPGANHAPHQIWPELIGNPHYDDDPELQSRCTYNTGSFTQSPVDSGYGTYTPETSVFKAGYEQYRKDIFAVMKTPLGASVRQCVEQDTENNFEGYFPDGVEESFPDYTVTGLGIFSLDTSLPSINPHGEGVPGDPNNNNPLYGDDFLIHKEDSPYEQDKKWPSTEYVIPWEYNEDGTKDNRQELFIRMAETYAAFSTYTDRQIGRLLDYLKDTEQFDNTIIIAVADNGASGEGGPNGSVNENLFFNDIPDSLDNNMAAIGDLGTDKTYNHYPSGWAWAFDTPFKYWKRWSNYEGGDATPFMICGPCIQDSDRGSGFRKQYVHAIDLVPTLYEYLGLDEETDIATVKGYEQNPIEGTSFAYTFDVRFDQEEYQYPYKLPFGTAGIPVEGTKAKVKDTQFYAMLGTRGIWYKGWHACTFHPPTPSDWGEFDKDDWELYCMDGDTLNDESPFLDICNTLDNKLSTDDWPSRIVFRSGSDVPQDPTQISNLMNEDTLQEMFGDLSLLVKLDLDQVLEALQAKWFSEARKYYGKPLDDRSTSEVLGEERPQLSDPPNDGKYTYPYYPGCSEIPEAVAPNIRGRSYSITATVDFTAVGDLSKVQGVLFSHGGRFGGHSLYIKGEQSQPQQLRYVYNWLGQQEQKIVLDIPDEVKGKQATLTFRFTKVETLSPPDPTYGSSTVGSIELSISDGSSILSSVTSPSENFNAYSDQFLTQPGKFSLCGEGMNLGRDAGQPVTTDYVTPYEFEGTGAILKQVEVWANPDDTEADEFERSKALAGMLWRD